MGPWVSEHTMLRLSSERLFLVLKFKGCAMSGGKVLIICRGTSNSKELLSSKTSHVFKVLQGYPLLHLLGTNTRSMAVLQNGEWNHVNCVDGSFLTGSLAACL